MILGPNEGGTPLGIHLMRMQDGRPATIPCKLTDPKFTMKLYNINGVEIEQSPLLTYNPKMGFHVFAGQAKYSGTLKCVATFANLEDEFIVQVHYSRKKCIIYGFNIKGHFVHRNKTLLRFHFLTRLFEEYGDLQNVSVTSKIT